jgi:sporulation protein YlmC with PRC-barrel domain
MTSSGEGERFTIGAHVDATDGRCGHLTRVIVDPKTETLTHLAVQPGHHEDRARLVPIHLVAGVEGELIRLSCTTEQFDRLDPAEEIELLTSADMNIVGMRLSHQPGSKFGDVLPEGEVAVRKGDAVHAKDGYIGEVEGVVIDPASDLVTHVLLQEGHLWGRKEVAIPIGAANRVGNEIRVDLTKEEIEALPPAS